MSERWKPWRTWTPRMSVASIEKHLGGMSQPLKEEAMGKSKVQVVIWVTR